MAVNLKILETDAQITAKIRRVLIVDLNKRLVRSATKLGPKLRKIIKDSIQSQPEYISLRDGDLMIELGLVDGSNRLDSIIEHWIDSLIISLKPVRSVGSKLKGGIEIKAIKSDYSDVLELSESVFTTEKGSDLRWLEWLLLEGDNAIILDYSIMYGNFKRSRTGGGIMVQRKGSSWRVPPEFSGTIDNNFVTRALDEASVEIEDTIVKTVLGDL